MNAAILSRSASTSYGGLGLNTIALDRRTPGRVRENTMNKFSTITALAFAGMLAIAPGAQAGGLYDNDDDDNRVTSEYNRKSPGINDDHDNGATSEYSQQSPSSNDDDDNGVTSQYSQQSPSSNDDDDNGATGQYNQQSPSSDCDDDDCAPQAKGNHQQKSYNGSYTAGSCAALVRAVGKRNSARFAWTREARFVHGDQYANWGRARDAHISCTRVGALSSCEAIATPCY
jgi:hypothetical protein